MSSNRAATTCDALVSHGDRPVGPLKMPITNVEMFVEEFNRTYRSIGLSVTINELGKAIVHPAQSQPSLQ